MTNKKYAQGRYAEYAVRNFFKKEGYSSWRTAGSHGPFDVIAVNSDEVVLAQVKSFLETPGNYKEDIKKLKELECPSYVTKLMVLYMVGKGIIDIERVE